MELLTKDYATIWDQTVPKPGTYKAGERKKHQFIEFLTIVKFTHSDWEYWMERISYKPWNKLEQEFISTLIKQRFLTRRVITMNSITASIEAEGKVQQEFSPTFHNDNVKF